MPETKQTDVDEGCGVGLIRDCLFILIFSFVFLLTTRLDGHPQSSASYYVFRKPERAIEKKLL